MRIHKAKARQDLSVIGMDLQMQYDQQVWTQAHHLSDPQLELNELQIVGQCKVDFDGNQVDCQLGAPNWYVEGPRLGQPVRNAHSSASEQQ